MDRKGLEDALKRESGRLRKAVAKTRMMGFRATEEDAESMKATAKACGLTLTEYLIALHRFAAEALSEKKRN